MTTCPVCGTTLEHETHVGEPPFAEILVCHWCRLEFERFYLEPELLLPLEVK